MQKSFNDRLSKLERGQAIEVYVILFGDECDDYDRALDAGDTHGAFDVLRKANEYIDDEVLWQVVRERAPFQDISPRATSYQPTLIRAEHHPMELL